MSLHHITPSHQQSLWIQEVRYLHALWHHATPIPRPRPNSNPSPALSSRPSFKKQNPNTNKSKKNSNNRNKINTPSKQKQQHQLKPQPQHPVPPVVEIEWPCPPTPPPNPNPTAWAALVPNPSAARPIPSAKDQARAAAARAQCAALGACEVFFSARKDGSSSSSDDDDDDEISDEDDDEMDWEGLGESEVFEFFLGLFERDAELRGYYEKNCENGEFNCLVCWGIGEKKGRRYPGCVGLVQHANAISKTKRRWAHRALAQVVCRVLGWDINRLPSIVLDLADPLGKTLAEAAHAKEILQQGETTKEKEELQKEDVRPLFVEIEEITDEPNEDATLDEKEKLSNEVGETVQKDDGNLMERTSSKEDSTREVDNADQ